MVFSAIFCSDFPAYLAPLPARVLWQTWTCVVSILETEGEHATLEPSSGGKGGDHMGKESGLGGGDPYFMTSSPMAAFLSAKQNEAALTNTKRREKRRVLTRQFVASQAARYGDEGLGIRLFE